MICVSLLNFFEEGNAGGEGQSEWSLLGQREGPLTDAGRSRVQRTEVVKLVWSEDSESGGHLS